MVYVVSQQQPHSPLHVSWNRWQSRNAPSTPTLAALRISLPSPFHVVLPLSSFIPHRVGLQRKEIDVIVSKYVIIIPHSQRDNCCLKLLLSLGLRDFRAAPRFSAVGGLRSHN